MAGGIEREKSQSVNMIEEDILGIGNWGCLKCHSYNPQENSLCATCNSFRPLETYPNILTSPLTVTNMEVEAVEFRRKEERQLISGLEKEGGEFYMINSKWLKEWKSFVFNKAMGGDVSKSINKRIGIFPPGPISNHELFVLNPEKRELKSNLLLNKHYNCVSKYIWEALFRIYQGGPLIIRKELDIYSQQITIDNSTQEESIQRNVKENLYGTELHTQSHHIELQKFHCYFGEERKEPKI